MFFLGLTEVCMRTAYLAEVLKDGHLSFPKEIKQKLRLHEGMKIKVTIECAEKSESTVRKESALRRLFSQELNFASWEAEKEGLTNQRIKDIEAAGH